MRSKLFFIWLIGAGKLKRKIFCEKETKLCNGLSVDDTISLREYLGLWTLGRPA